MSTEMSKEMSTDDDDTEQQFNRALPEVDFVAHRARCFPIVFEVFLWFRL